MTPLIISVITALLLLAGWLRARDRRAAAAGAAFARRTAAARREARPSTAEIQCLWDSGCDEDRAVGDPYCPGHIALMCGRAVAA